MPEVVKELAFKLKVRFLCKSPCLSSKLRKEICGFQAAYWDKTRNLCEVSKPIINYNKRNTIIFLTIVVDLGSNG